MTSEPFNLKAFALLAADRVDAVTGFDRKFGENPSPAASVTPPGGVREISRPSGLLRRPGWLNLLGIPEHRCEHGAITVSDFADDPEAVPFV